MTSLRSIATLGIVCALTAGCAKYHSAPFSPTDSAAAYQARTLDNPALKKFVEDALRHPVGPWPPKSWNFPDLTLVAWYYHPDLEVARAQWKTAEAAIITAGMYPNPSVGVTPQWVSNSAPPWTITQTADIPIVTAGKIKYRKAQAGRLAQSAFFNLLNAAWQVRNQLRTAFLGLYAAMQKEAVLQKQADVQQDTTQLLEERLRNGEASQVDVMFSRITLNQTLVSLYDAKRQKEEARVNLATALGLQVAALDGAQFSFDLLTRPVSAKDLPAKDVQQNALLNRRDILSALQDYAAAEEALKLEIANQYPDIHIGPGFEWDQGLNKWTVVGPSFVVPIFNQNQGPIAEATARRKESASRFTALQARVIGDADRALAACRASITTLNTADALVSAQERQLQSVKALFQGGEADRLALLTAEVELNSTVLSRLDALVRFQESLGLLEDAMQRPMDPTEPPPPLPAPPQKSKLPSDKLRAAPSKAPGPQEKSK